MSALGLRSNEPQACRLSYIFRNILEQGFSQITGSSFNDMHVFTGVIMKLDLFLLIVQKHLQWVSRALQQSCMCSCSDVDIECSSNPTCVSFFFFVDLKKTLAVLLDNIMLRLGKLESKVENIYNGTGGNLTNAISTATPSATNSEKVNVAGMIV